ncbi:hypothetical protein HG536_0F00530 [Torulaspora globosa]|uniref:Phosphoadenosine phosphosulphate reductase domain-containing protein n=1 Tax=Torulaspora globosa TaxID=48254 RepID=A0A7G3ZJP2_9SACH|nr:uncharacterized protein HG536_0F00530 [Torulaspora globosa]QLL33728.1 hypothetical protein HG536_0F00530 [Torulaspora globosa]
MGASRVFRLNNGVSVTQEQLDHWNRWLSKTSGPQEVIRWAVMTFPHLYQTTAFGLTGLATIDMLAKLRSEDSEVQVPLIFVDTLHHFPQTLDLLAVVQERYYTPVGQQVAVFRPEGCASEKEFAAAHGEFLWERDEDKYDFLVKAEPARRAYKSLGCTAVFTGRRRSQGAARSALQFVEVDELNGIVKINPLADWTFDQVRQYVDDNNVPFNELLNYGYRSIGDYHSTAPVQDGEDERAGRWKGKNKTECGIHETSRFAKYLESTSTAK